MKYCIVILDRGFVYVGQLSAKDTDNTYTLTDASCIRRWGTSAGLGQLVTEGPQGATVLDPCATVVIPEKSLISIHPTDEKLWNRKK